MTITLWNISIIAFVVTAAASDLWARKIPRWLTVTGFFAGLLYHGYYGGLKGALGAAFVAFVIGILFFSMGAIGGGDVKLITALGAMMGSRLLPAMQIAILAAAALAVVEIVRHRAVRQTLRNVWEILKNLFTHGLHAHPQLNVKNPAALRSPFAVAAAVGVIVAVIKF